MIDENVDDDADYGELVNNEFLSPFDQEIRPTGATIIHDGVLFAQYSNCHCELYYESCEIYGDDPNESEEAINRIANSSKVWTLCDNALSLRDDSIFHSELLYDQHVIKQNQQLAYQGVLDNCEDVGITEAELHEAHAPLKPNIRRPETIDYDRKRKYTGHVPADIVQCTFKYTTQIGTLPPSTHLQRQFKSPNPALNLYRQNEADDTDQIFSKEPALDGAEINAHIFV